VTAEPHHTPTPHTCPTRRSSDLTHINTTAEKTANGYRLNGSKAVVLHGDSADQLVVVARTSGNNPSSDGLSVFIVPADAEGVSRSEEHTSELQSRFDLVCRLLLA